MKTPEINAMTLAEKSQYLRENFKQTKLSKIFRSSVHGVGINDADYLISKNINGVIIRCPAYRSWKNMLERCYSSSYHKRQPTYKDAYTSKEWKSFSEFRKWWIENQVDGWQLDKDLIGDGNLYSSKTCIFVPSWLNSFANNCKSSRGSEKLGCYFSKSIGRFVSQCSHPFDGKEHLGVFEDEESAHRAWRDRKLEIANELKSKMDDIDTRIYKRIILMIYAAK